MVKNSSFPCTFRPFVSVGGLSEGYTTSMRYDGQTVEELLAAYGASEVSAMDVYGDIFDLGGGLIQRSGEHHTSKPNPIILGKFGEKVQRQIMLEDTFEEQLRYFQEAEWSFLNGITYWGRFNRGNTQGQMCAMIFDLDGIQPTLLNNFLHACFVDVFDGHGFYPIPNYIILSGHNVHLYYVFEAPIYLYPQAKYELKKLKYGLTRRIWNPNTSEIEKPQYQGINQGFRIIGGKTKNGGVVRAFRLNTHPFSVATLNEYVQEDERANVTEVVNPTRKYTLKEAQQLFPEWYERVVVLGLPKKTWECNEGLYNWWLKKLWSGVATWGHRYFCIMALAIFAAKCGILDRDRVKKDAMELLDTFNSLKPTEPFTEDDIDSALECLDLRYCRFPRHDIEKITAVRIDSNKRRKGNDRIGQEKHLYLARRRKEDMKTLGIDFKNPEGRPAGSLNKQYPKRDLILNYKEEHPEATQREIAKALGVSPTTVNKWLKSE